MDPIDRQAAIEAINHICPVDTEYDCTLLDRVDVRCVLSDLPSAQPEQSDASEFWRKRADYYSYMCLELISEMGKGVKIASVKLSENGLEFIKEQPAAQPEWIPCSERLPKEDGQYLITEKGTFGDYLYVRIANYGVPCMPMNKGKGRGWYIMDSEGEYYCDMNHVLAWMPIPMPYKERRK